MTKSVNEKEQPAKQWQIAEVATKIDANQAASLERHKAIEQSISEVKQMIAAQNQTYPTRTELALELEKRDNRIADIKKTLTNYSKVVWIIVSTLIPIVVMIVWNIIVNNAKAGN